MNLYSFIATLLLGGAAVALNSFGREPMAEIIFYVPVVGSLIAVFFIYPVVLTAMNLVFLFTKREWAVKAGLLTELITIVLGVSHTLLYTLFLCGPGNGGIQFQADWQEVLYNAERHTPVWTQAQPAVIVFALAGILGYLVLSSRNIRRTPPLLAVLSISAMYIGMICCVVWIVQLKPTEFYLCLFPFNCVVIAVKTIRRKVAEWNGSRQQETDGYNNSFLGRINRLLSDASRWPAAAFLLMWPLMGILIGIVVLFGQRPDAIIRAWTETSGWTFSERVSPPNVYYDEHYLCTVAAQGHAGIVKPLRSGMRHGHRVTVNRQLCVANAFEQVLEERMPGVHRVVRRFYDAYGFPVARLVRSPCAADVIYILMKPLEWLFLAVIYLVDEKPENRIAVQYPHAPVPGKNI